MKDVPRPHHQGEVRRRRKRRESAPRGLLSGGDPLGGGRPAAVGHAGRAVLAEAALDARW